MLSFNTIRVFKNIEWILEPEVNAEICTERNGVFVHRGIKVINKFIDGKS